MKTRNLKLLDELRKDSRKSLTQISHATGIPLSSVFKIILNFKNKGIVSRYVTLPDFSRLGYPIKTAVFMKTKDRKEMVKRIRKEPSLNTLARLSGSYELYAEFIFKNIAEHQDLIESLESNKLIEKMKSCFLIDIKRETFKFCEN